VAVMSGALVAGVGGVAAGCREALSPPGPPRGPNLSAPSLVYHPGQDTVVDSLGTLRIEVTARDESFIDSVTVVLSGASLAFPAVHPADTVFHGFFSVPLASQRHQPFSFVVVAADILGHDTTTGSVTVRVR
jgi:hypothetical protein